MKHIVLIIAVLSMFVLVGCSPLTFSTYTNGAFSVDYPDWQGSLTEEIAVQERDCRVAVKHEAININQEDLEAIIEAAVPVYEAQGVSVSSSVVGNQGVLELSGEVSGEARYTLCEGNLFLTSAACSTERPIINQVMSSIRCAA